MSGLDCFRVTITYTDGTPPFVYPSKSRHGRAGAVSFARFMRRADLDRHGEAAIVAEPITLDEHDAMERAHVAAMVSGARTSRAAAARKTQKCHGCDAQTVRAFCSEECKARYWAPILERGTK